MIKDKQKKLETGIEKRLDILEKVVNTAYLSIGSNLGDRIINIEKTKNLILFHKMNILKSSSFYETPSWPNTKLPKYINIVLKINTDLSLPNLFLNLKNIEKLIGRTPGPRNSPRVCDIDIIDYNQKNYSIKIKKDFLIVPHPRMSVRNFVLLPLFEICNHWKHPKTKQKITELMSKLPLSSITAIKVM